MEPPTQMNLGSAEPCGLPSAARLPHPMRAFQRPSGWVSAASQEDVQFPISGVIPKSQLWVICSAPPEGLSVVKEQGPLPLCWWSFL